MSAFLCSDLHVSVLAVWMERINPEMDAPTLAGMLRAVNSAALVARYRAEPEPPFVFTPTHRRDAGEWLRAPAATAGAVFTLAACLYYQCDEFDEAARPPEWPVLVNVYETARACAGGVKPAHAARSI